MTYIYKVSQEESARLQEDVPYVKVHLHIPKHLQWTLELRPAWHKNNLGYYKNLFWLTTKVLSYDPNASQGQNVYLLVRL
jgi:hypothetical protein